MFAKRFFYVCVGLFCLALGSTTPCRAGDFVLVWSHSGSFPGSQDPAGNPLPPSYFGDFNGDGSPEIIIKPDPDDATILEVRDFATGIVEGTINLSQCCGSYARSVTKLAVPGVLDRILVTTGVVGGGPTAVGVAVFAWSATAGVQSEPSQGPRMITTPNPFQQRTMIHFTLDTPGRAELRIFDVAGRVVRKLSAGRLAAGSHQVEWDGTDESTRPLSEGTYFYALIVDGRTVGSQKAVLLH